MRGRDIVAFDRVKLLDTYSRGDLVHLKIVGNPLATLGVVDSVNYKTEMINVKWGDGEIRQQNPEEIMLTVDQEEDVANKMLASTERRGSMDEDPQYMGDPEEHGMEEPIGGGFNVMQDLAKAQHTESKEVSVQGPKSVTQQSVVAGLSEVNNHKIAAKNVELPKEFIGPNMVIDREMVNGKDIKKIEASVSGSKINLTVLYKVNGKNLKSKASFKNDWRSGWNGGITRLLSLPISKGSKFKTWVKSNFPDVKTAMYWGGQGRRYILTKGEQVTGIPLCPRCKESLRKEKYTKNCNILLCECGFKIMDTEVSDKKIVVEISQRPSGDIEAVVTRRG